MKQLVFPQKVLDQHLIALGKTGAGKSSALRHIVEWLLEHQKRVCVIDPKGDWYGLKASADGKGPGFPVVLFGDFKDNIKGDVPLIPNSQLDNPDFDVTPAAKHVAELVVSGNRPCVIGMRGWTQGNMTRFWIEFAPKVFNSESGELYLVNDEIHNFAPKGKVLSVDAGKSLHWTNRLINEGRGIGLMMFAASQRPQKVHNDTLDACETLIAMRVVHPAARKSIKDWLDGAGDKASAENVYDSLAGLERGEAIVWSPEIKFGPERVRFPMFETYDSFAPPKLQKKVSEKGWATVDLTEVKEKLAAVIARAKAEDPKELQKEIRDLRKQLSSKPTTSAKTVESVKTIEKPALKDAQIARLEKFGGSLEAVATKLTVVAREIKDGLAKVSTNGHKPAARAPRPVRETPARPAPRAMPSRSVEIAEDLSGPERRILDAIAWLESLGIESPEQTAVAFLAGYTFGGGGFNNPKGRLNTRGFVSYVSGNRISLTDEGRAHANYPDEVLTAEELQRRVLERLPGPERKILQVLLVMLILKRCQTKPAPNAQDTRQAAEGLIIRRGDCAHSDSWIIQNETT